MSETDLWVRQAELADLPAMVAMLADDFLGAQREDTSQPLAQGYLQAFADIKANPANELVVLCRGNEVLGMLHLTILTHISHQGSKRAFIENVRIASSARSQGLGKILFNWVIQRSREHGCRMVELSTDKRRDNAKKFYESLGFVASHEGMKLLLEP